MRLSKSSTPFHEVVLVMSMLALVIVPSSAMAVDADAVTYTPSTLADWINQTVNNVADALDELAGRIQGIEDQPAHPVIVFSTWSELVSGLTDLAASTTSDGATFMLEQGVTLESTTNPAFLVDLPTTGLDGKKIIIDGGGGTLTYTGSATSATVLTVRGRNGWPNNPLDVQIRHWNIRNEGESQGIVGIRHGGIGVAYLFHDVSVTGPGFHVSGSGARAFVIDGYTYVSNITRSLLSSEGAIVSLDSGTVFSTEYSTEIRDSIIGEYWRENVGPCLDFTADRAVGPGGFRPYPATLHTQGVQFFGCDGMIIDGIHWYSVGDLFDTIRYPNPGSAGSWNPWFTVGRATSYGPHSNVDIQEGVAIGLNRGSGKLVYFQGDFQSFHADIRAVLVESRDTTYCEGKRLLQSTGILFDAATGVHGEHVSVVIEAPDDPSSGESCFASANVPDNFTTANAKTMLADGMSGSVKGNKQNYVLLRDKHYLGAGTHQLASDLYDDSSPDDGTGNKICADGGGLSCIDVALATGANQQGFASTPSARCSHAFTASEVVDVICQ